MTVYDAAVIGGGPGGAVFAARLASLGRSVIVLERAHHPRFHLGESLLPGSVGVLDAIGVLEEVRDTFMVKRGARFVEGTGGPDARTARYAFGDAFSVRWDHAFQVPRDQFDALLLRRASACGAEVREGCEVTSVVFEGGRAVGVEARSEEGAARSVAARVVVDASGRDAVLARTARSVQRIAHLDRTALFTQVRGAWRDVGEREGDIQIVVFGEGEERGWFWLIPFRDGRTSVGAVVSGAWIRARQHLSSAEESGGSLRAPGGAGALFEAALESAPTVAWMIDGAERVLAPGATADFSFRVGAMRGDGWVTIGDAGGFIDPLFSTGAHLAMHGALCAADAVHAALDAGAVTAERLEPLEREIRGGADLFTGVVQAFYAGDLVPQIFADPQHPFLRRAITSLLSGDVFTDARWVREMRARFPPQA